MSPNPGIVSREETFYSGTSELPVIVTAVAIIHPVVMIVAMMNSERSIDHTDRAAGGRADGAADRTGGTIGLVSPFICPLTAPVPEPQRAPREPTKS